MTTERIYVLAIPEDDAGLTAAYDLLDLVEETVGQDREFDLGDVLDEALEDIGSAVTVGSCRIREILEGELVTEADAETGEECLVEVRWVFECPASKAPLLKQALTEAVPGLSFDFDQPPITFGLK